MRHWGELPVTEYRMVFTEWSWSTMRGTARSCGGAAIPAIDELNGDSAAVVLNGRHDA